MSTYVQRVQAICDAVLNATASPEQIDRLGRGIASCEGNTGYAAMGGAQKAEFIVRHIRAYLISMARHQEAQAAAATASAQTAAEVDLAFPES